MVSSNFPQFPLYLRNALCAKPQTLTAGTCCSVSSLTLRTSRFTLRIWHSAKACREPQALCLWARGCRPIQRVASPWALQVATKSAWTRA